MDFSKLRLLPAAIALSMMMVPVAFAGEDGGPPKAEDGQEENSPPQHQPEQTPPEHQQPSRPDNEPSPPDKAPNPRPSPSPSPRPHSGGGGNSHEYGSSSIACRIGNRSVYVASFRQCNELKYALGYGGSARVRGSVSIQGGGQYQGSYVYGGGGYATGGGYGYYQPQRVIRYVAMPSRAAQMQAERRARKAARRAAQAYGNGYGYGDGGMVGYGNGVMVGGYGNNVVVNGSVYGGAYAGNGYGYGGQQIVIKKKRHGRKARRVMMYQQPTYIQQPGMVYGGGNYGYSYGGTYGYEGPIMYKGGGY